MRPANEASHILWWMGRAANLTCCATALRPPRLSMLVDSASHVSAHSLLSLSTAATAAQRRTEVAKLLGERVGSVRATYLTTRGGFTTLFAGGAVR